MCAWALGCDLAQSAVGSYVITLVEFADDTDVLEGSLVWEQDEFTSSEVVTTMSQVDSRFLWNNIIGNIIHMSWWQTCAKNMFDCLNGIEILGNRSSLQYESSMLYRGFIGHLKIHCI